MAKNIVLCSDGTGNMGGKAEGTNVWRLFLAIDQTAPTDANVPRQFAFYDDGVGSQSFKLFRAIGGAFGWGISRNLERLYGYLIQNYEPEDRIFLFGFSRGAFTVRVLAEMIALCGIARNENDDDPKKVRELTPTEIGQRAHEALQAYKNQKREWLGSRGAADTFRQRYAHPEPLTRPVKCLGAWDTVDAVGLPFEELTAAFRWLFPLRFRHCNLSASVENAYHALSIDEARLTFRPVIWSPPPADSGQTVEQVWFPGVHANVGGGYPKEQLALVALTWMIDKAERLGLRFHASLKEEFRRGANPQGHLYDSRAGLGAYYRYGPRLLDRVGDRTPLSEGLPEKEKSHLERPSLHVSVLQRLAEGTDGYAPTGIPQEYEVVGGPVPERARETQPENRIEHMETAHDLIWWQRGSYYAFLILTIILLFGGWVLSWEARPPDPTALTTTALEPVRAVAPWKLGDVVLGYEKWPWFLLWLAAFLLMLRWSVYLRTRTQAVAVAAWRRGFGHDVPRRSRGVLSRLARPIRTSTWVRNAARVFKWNVMPPLVLAAVFVTLFGRWLWYAHSLPRPEPTPADSLVRLRAGESKPISFDTTDPFHATGYELVRGERYRVLVAAARPAELSGGSPGCSPSADEVPWHDGDLPATPLGLCPGWEWRPFLWLGIPLRRVVQAPWFQLRGEIGSTGHVQMPIISGTEFEAGETGELFLYVNDVPGCYGNNRGTALVTIVHRPAGRAP